MDFDMNQLYPKSTLGNLKPTSYLKAQNQTEDLKTFTNYAVNVKSTF